LHNLTDTTHEAWAGRSRYRQGGPGSHHQYMSQFIRKSLRLHGPGDRPLHWSGWPVWNGISGRIGPEYATSPRTQL